VAPLSRKEVRSLKEELNLTSREVIYPSDPVRREGSEWTGETYKIEWDDIGLYVLLNRNMQVRYCKIISSNGSRCFLMVI